MEKIEVVSPGAPKAIGPYSQAIVSNGFLFASGQIPINPESGKIECDTIAEQTKRVLENIRALLAAQNLSMDSVIKTTVFMTNLSEFDRMNAVYADFFPRPFPARSCVQVASLPRGAKVEIEIIAKLS